MDKRTLRCCIYARVSTSHHDQNPEVQLAALREYCERRGWALIEEITDHGFSGGTTKRPGFVKLMNLVRARKIDVVVVSKMDRLFRSLKHLIGTLDEFKEYNIQFVSLGDAIDLTTSAGRLMVQIIGAFGEFERALVRERTLAGLEHAKQAGKRLGRPRIASYDAILGLRESGLSYSAIQKELGVSRPVVGRAIRAASTK